MPRNIKEAWEFRGGRFPFPKGPGPCRITAIFIILRVSGGLLRSKTSPELWPAPYMWDLQGKGAEPEVALRHMVTCRFFRRPYQSKACRPRECVVLSST